MYKKLQFDFFILLPYFCTKKTNITTKNGYNYGNNTFDKGRFREPHSKD